MMRFALVALLLVACAKKKADNAAPAEHEPGTQTAAERKVETAKAAATVELKPLDPAEAQDLAHLKQRTSSDVSEWILEETMADGWAALYSMPRIENVQDEKGQVERKQTGLDYGVYVHRTINDQAYKCAKIVRTKEEAKTLLDACKRL